MRINLDVGSRNRICEYERSPIGIDRIPLPNLSAPEKTRVSTRGSGGGFETYTSSAILETNLTSQALVNHYEELFKQAGWARIR